MLRSIAQAINLKNIRKKLLYCSVFFRSFYWASLTYGYLWYSVSVDNSEKKNIIRGYTCIRTYSRRISGFTDHRTAFTHVQGAIFQSRDFNLRVERERKIPYPRS